MQNYSFMIFHFRGNWSHFRDAPPNQIIHRVILFIFYFLLIESWRIKMQNHSFIFEESSLN